MHLKQHTHDTDKEYIMLFHFGAWNPTQENIVPSKKKFYPSISKFQDYLLNQPFLIRVDCKAAKDALL